jgi:hypothetical protein
MHFKPLHNSLLLLTLNLKQPLKLFSQIGEGNLDHSLNYLTNLVYNTGLPALTPLTKMGLLKENTDKLWKWVSPCYLMHPCLSNIGTIALPRLFTSLTDYHLMLYLNLTPLIMPCFNLSQITLKSRFLVAYASLI